MLTVTGPAAEHLAKLLSEAEAPEGTAARFIANQEGLSLQVDSPKPEDQTIEHNGKTVLLLDEQVAELLDDKTLDLEETDEGPALTLQAGEEEESQGETA